MEYSIKYSTIAEQSLNNIFDYIDNILCNHNAAINITEGIISTINSLKTFPKKHKLCDEEFLSIRNIRSTRFKNYKILYYIDENANVVLILNIFYIKRDTKNVISF